ncbi:MAG: hypothetical protein PF450_14680, partial [Bacteroidales bacterium]|nr:hypothetical protein [Bacteroidales bacterium]
DSDFDFMAIENDVQESQENEIANPVRTGFPPFEAVVSVSALDKVEDSKEEAEHDLDAPDIEALMKLAENESVTESASNEQIIEDEASSDAQEAMEDKPSVAQQAMEDKPVEINQEQEVGTESITSLSGGDINLNEENKDMESENDIIQDNHDNNAEAQPEVNLNPLDGNTANDELDDEKTIIASPEDFETMLSESTPQAEQTTEPESVQNEEPVAEAVLEEPSVAEQAMEDKPAVEVSQEKLQVEDIQFKATVQASDEAVLDASSEAVLEEPSAAQQAMEDKPSVAQQAMEDKPAVEVPEENIQAEDIQFESTVQASAEAVAKEPAVEVPEENIQAEDIQFESTVQEVAPAEEQVLQPEGLQNEELPADVEEQTLVDSPVEGLPQGLQNNEAPLDAEQAMEDKSAEQYQPESIGEGLELNPPVELSSETEVDDEKTIVLEPTNSAFSDKGDQSDEIPAVQEAMAEGLDDAEQTLSDSDNQGGLDLVDSSQESASEDVSDASEETIMAAPGDNPAETNRMKYTGDINELIEKPVPTEIPEERIKSLVFLYANSDETLCAEILNTMDVICLKSETKPMFIKRPVVKVCEPHVRGDSAQELIAEHSALGLICVGDMPSEIIYDIENVFNTKKMFFKHVNKESFNHELIVDIVADLILI